MRSYREDSYANPSQWANLITLMRIFGVVFIFFVTPFKSVLWQLWIILLYTLICFSDYVDGWVARRFNIVSDVGKILDPFADKILVLIFLPLLEMKAISSFPVFIILAREFAIMAIRVVAAKKGHIISANLSGKIKTAITFPVCGILLGRVHVPVIHEIPAYLMPLRELQLWVQSWPLWVIKALVVLMVLATLWSFIDYFCKFIWQLFLEKAKGDRDVAILNLKKLIPNAISAGNLLCGMYSIYLAYHHHIFSSVFLILVCIFLDGLDGSLARKLNAQSPLGAKLDSRADFVSFGIAPAVVIWAVLSRSAILYAPIIGAITALFYYVCVHYRLKRFSASGGHSDTFQGLPSPAGASLVVLGAASSLLSTPYYFTVVSFTASILMISSIPYLHNHATRNTFLRYLRQPTLVLFVIVLLALSHVSARLTAETTLLVHLLLGSIGVYVISPALFYIAGKVKKS